LCSTTDDCKSADGIDWTPTGFIMQQAGKPTSAASAAVCSWRCRAPGAKGFGTQYIEATSHVVVNNGVVINLNHHHQSLL
jgi:hypothetical protein